MDLASEEVTHGGEVASRLGAALHPLAGAVLLGRFRHFSRDRKQSNLRVLRGRDFLFGVGRIPNGPLHVGLPGTDPHLARQNIPDGYRVLAFQRDLIRPPNARGSQAKRPFALLVRLDPPVGAMPAHRDADLFARIGPSPQRNALPRLQDHVVPDDCRQADIRVRRGRKCDYRETQDQARQTAESDAFVTHLATLLHLWMMDRGSAQLPSEKKVLGPTRLTTDTVYGCPRGQ